jgi:predicted transcriptional regulator
LFFSKNIPIFVENNKRYINLKIMIMIMTDNNKKPHVQVPDPVKETKLKPFDKLVYANLRKYMNKDTYECFPTIRRIASECGCTEKRVTNSIERLIEAGDIEKTKRIGRSNVYKFNKLSKNFEMFTNNFLDQKDTTPEEKAYLIGLQSQTYKDGGFAMTTKTNEEIAEALNIDTRSVQRYNKSLKEKQILVEMKTAILDSAGYNRTVKAIDLAKVCQAVLYVNERVDVHETRLNAQEDRITILEKMVSKLMQEKTELEKQLFDKKEIINEFEFN